MEGGERTAVAQQSHRFGSGGGVGGSEFFICFTSRPSSSSLRIPSSKSLPSPGRADKYRDPAAAPSLSASLSRRLKNSGSMKGGQSPATIPGVGGSRKKSCPFEAAEPSSPKVTCIGQVKVKTARMKKKKKTLSSSSKQATRSGGEATFRMLEQRDLREDKECLPNRNQRWVHVPLSSICDALRAFGSEFNCFLPCGGGGRSQCSSSAGVEREKGERTVGVDGGTRVGEKRARGGGMGSCGAAFARWLMAIQESEGVKRGEMVDLVVEEVGGRGMARELRGVDLLMDVEKGVGMKEESEERQGALLAAVPHGDEGETVCVPPPNALLLMRCRSDPVRMAALANRFWVSPATRVEVEEVEEDHDEEGEVGNKEEGTERLTVQNGEEEKESAVKGDDGGGKAVTTASIADTVLREDRVGMADAKSLGICLQDGEGGGEEETKLQPQQCHEKGERDGGNQRCAEATTEMNNPSQGGEDQGAKLEEAAADKEAACLTGSHPPVAFMEKEEDCFPAREQEEAEKEEVPSKPRRSASFSAERQHGRRLSFSREKEDGRRCKEKEGRRHSFSTEKESGRTGSGRRSSFSVEGDALRSTLCTEGEGRRRWSFASEKEVRRPPLVETAAEAAEAAVVMGLGSAGEKKRKKKKKKEGEDEGEEMGAPGVDAETEARSFDCSTTTTAAAAAAAEEEGEGKMGRRGDNRSELPDCLLLMMYEPKLSMEVSRETWVCTSDFLRFRPHRHRQQPPPHHQPNQADAAAQGAEAPAAVGDVCGGESKPLVTASSDDAALPHPSPPPPLPPPTAPARASAAALPRARRLETIQTVEQKLAPSTGGGPPSSTAYGPCGLTRCKSEPMRSSVKLEPDACFWKSRHRPIGAAGIGF